MLTECDTHAAGRVDVDAFLGQKQLDRVLPREHGGDVQRAEVVLQHIQILP